jgi:long-subunit acyl-CoA synthetase (AMP-forming)
VTISEIFPNVSKAVSMVEAERRNKIPVIMTPGIQDNTVPQGTIKFQDMTHKDIDISNLAADDKASSDGVAFLPYSSGTTGLPKGVNLSQRHLLTNCLQVVSEPRICALTRTTSKYSIHIA